MATRYVRHAAIALGLMLAGMSAAFAQLSIQYNVPGASIGLNLGGYPTLQRIPGYPVYYAPGVNTNYFFYDGLYWVFDGDRWYASSWYNGPWGVVDPFYVPDYVLRVPVRYYRHAPAYFRGWRADAPPRWNEHWGRSWQDRRRDWDRWDRRYSPSPAPLPTYQRQYRGDRYPQQTSQQADLHVRNYRYQPRDNVAREHYQERRQEQQQYRQQQPRYDRSQPQPNHEPRSGRGQDAIGGPRDENTQERNQRLGSGG